MDPITPGAIGGILEIFNAAKKFFLRANVVSGSSLTDYTKVITVDPICIVDSSVKTSEALVNTQNTLLTLFAGFYTQAIALSNSQYEINISNRLEPFNNKQGKPLSTLISHVSSESIDSNPFTGEEFTISSEATSSDTNYGLDKVVEQIVNDSTLSVGKLVRITLKQGEKQISFPVGIRLAAGYMPSHVLLDLLTFGAGNTTALERKIAYQTGKIGLLDILLCRDLIRQFRRNLIRDKTGVFKTVMDNQSAGMVNKLITGKKQPGGISTICVLSSLLVRQIEQRENMKFNDPKKRQTLMDKTGTMIFAIIDEDYRIVKFYFHGIQNSMESSFDELKKQSKNDNLNVGDIMSALAMGNTPRL